MSENKLPLGWVETSLGDVADVIGGGTPRTSDPTNFEGGEIAWLTPADLSGYTEMYVTRGARNITEKGLTTSSAKLVPEGTVLFTSRAPIGYVAIARNPIATNQGFKSFKLYGEINPEYIYYYLKHAKQLAVDLSSGTTFAEISGKNAAKIGLSLAPLAEQLRIVAELDLQLSRLEDAVQALKRVQANCKRYRASVLKSAVEGRLVPSEAELAKSDGREYEPANELLNRILKERRAKWEAEQLANLQQKARNKNKPVPEVLPESVKQKYKEPAAPDTEDLPELPDGWCWCSIGQIVSVYVGSTPSRQIPEYWNGSIPWVSSGEVAFCRISGSREKITELGLANASTVIHPVGTVMLGMIGEGKTRGQTAILDVEACHNQNCAAIRATGADLVPEYLYYYLTQQYEVTRAAGSGNNQPALNKRKVEALVLPLPPLNEQARIAIELDRALTLVFHAEIVVSNNLMRAARLQQSILKCAFEGKLVLQDPNDEPASILLTRLITERAVTKKMDKSRKSKAAKHSQLETNQ